MALPTAFFTGYTLLAATDPAPAEGIFIPLTALSSLTSGEADEATGDGRKVCFEIAKAIHTKYTALSTKPTRMTTAESTPTGISASVIRKSYTMSFDLDVTAVDVANEPT